MTANGLPITISTECPEVLLDAYAPSGPRGAWAEKGKTTWAGVIYYSPMLGDALRAVLAALFVIASALSFLLFSNRRRTLVCFFGVCGVLVVLFFQIQPSNERDWQPKVSTTPHAEINGELVTIHGVRNFDYRTETDFTPESPPLSWKILLRGYVPEYLIN